MTRSSTGSGSQRTGAYRRLRLVWRARRRPCRVTGAVGGQAGRRARPAWLASRGTPAIWPRQGNTPRRRAVPVLVRSLDRSVVIIRQAVPVGVLQDRLFDGESDPGTATQPYLPGCLVRRLALPVGITTLGSQLLRGPLPASLRKSRRRRPALRTAQSCPRRPGRFCRLAYPAPRPANRAGRLLRPGHDVQCGARLADDVVHGHEGALRFEPRYRGVDEAHGREERLDQPDGRSASVSTCCAERPGRGP
jgi:hypothetical protein